MEKSFTSLNGTPFTVHQGEPDGMPTVFFLSVHKAGSTLLQRMVRELSELAGRSIVELPTELFRQGVALDECPLEVLLLLEEQGYVQSGFRTPWILPYLRSYRRAPKLLLVRDPRDIAVSFYFSMAKSHPVPEAGTTRDRVLQQRETASGLDPSSYVLGGHVNGVFASLDTFCQQIGRFDGFHVVRYEDVIFDKVALARQICETMGVDLDEDALQRVADRHDVRPTEARPDRHIRQVTPGGYREHLSDEAQDLILRRSRRAFEQFGYAA
jgi:hypothetical protein